MTRKIVSWVLVGIFAYAWWWIGYRWSYINSKGNEWTSVYALFTLISLVLFAQVTFTLRQRPFERLMALLSDVSRGPGVWDARKGSEA